MIYAIIWVVLSLVIGGWGADKSIGWGGGFFISLFFSPVIGVIACAVSEPNKKLREKRIREEEQIRAQAREDINKNN